MGCSSCGEDKKIADGMSGLCEDCLQEIFGKDWRTQHRKRQPKSTAKLIKQQRETIAKLEALVKEAHHELKEHCNCTITVDTESCNDVCGDEEAEACLINRLGAAVSGANQAQKSESVDAPTI